jgi:carrier protein
MAMSLQDVGIQLASGLAEMPIYPLNMIKVLMQVSHEPLPPFASKTIFGKEKLFYPNSFAYIKYVYTVDGVAGLYRGLGMKVLSTSVANLVYTKVSRLMDENEDCLNKNLVVGDEENKFEIFRKKTSREITIKCWAVVVSHPLHVMALRCMAQFVGGETNYSSWNVFQNAIEIYRTEGISGFFDGLMPRLLFEISSIAIASGLAYAMRAYVLDDSEQMQNHKLVDMTSSLIANSITYPLAVVTTVSCISGSMLVAGQPPKMPQYNSWCGVFKHLYETNGLKKGGSHFFRLYVPSVQYTSMSIY